jgi:hypothetical protein
VGATGATGAQGPAGPAGAAGTNGTDGKSVLNGTVDPAAGTGALGDFYLNTASNTLFGPKTSGGWGTGVSLVGPAALSSTYLRGSAYSGASSNGSIVTVDTLHLRAGDWIRIDNSMSRSGNCGGGDGQLWVETNFGQIIGYSSSGVNIGYNGYNAPQYAPNGVIYFKVSQNCTITVKFSITGGGCSGSTQGLVAVFSGGNSNTNSISNSNLNNLILTIDGF